MNMGQPSGQSPTDQASAGRSPDGQPLALWSTSTPELLKRLETKSAGLAAEEARIRLARYGPNVLKPRRKTATLTLLLSQFTSPIVLILLFAAGLSLFL